MTPDMKELPAELGALADRCEQATGGSDSLNEGVATALGWCRVANPTAAGGLVGMWKTPEGALTSLPDWSRSIDAAMMLVPEACDWIIGRTNDGLTIHAEVGGRGDEFMRFGSTPALALCAAALRAHLQANPIPDLDSKEVGR